MNFLKNNSFNNLRKIIKIEDKTKINFPLDEPSSSTDEEKKLNLRFYYDETNNFRKILFKNKELLNISNDKLFKNFVLGGIVLEKNQNVNIDNLKNLIKLDKTVKEMKLKHFGKCDFLDILKSKKIESLLKWLIDEKVNIHYISVNLLFWITLDIVETIENEIVFKYNRKLKSILYLLIKSDISEFLKIADSFNYPNIKKEDEKSFFKSLINFINKTEKNILEEDICYVNLLKRVLEDNQEELIFLKGKDKKIEDSFSHFYLDKIANFPNSYHYFDEEDCIIEDWKDYNFQYRGKDWKNYEFINSKDNELIQLSDIIVGLIGKLNEFLNIEEDISLSISKLNEQQKNNFGLFLRLLNSSADCNRFFLNDIMPISTEIAIQKMFDCFRN